MIMGPRKVELLPEKMQSSPVEEQIYYMAQMLGREFESVHSHFDRLETMLEGGQDQTKQPGFKSMQEFQGLLRGMGSISLLEKLRDRLKAESKIVVSLIIYGVVVLIGVLVLLIRTGTI